MSRSPRSRTVRELTLACVAGVIFLSVLPPSILLGSPLESSASWSSHETDASRNLAWGDWDGDWDLDLAQYGYPLGGS